MTPVSSLRALKNSVVKEVGCGTSSPFKFMCEVAGASAFRSALLPNMARCRV